MQYVENNSWKFIQYVGPKSCSLQYVAQKKSFDAVVVQWLRTCVRNSYTPFHMKICIHKTHLGVELPCNCILTN
jgi:hypothetical protein